MRDARRSPVAHQLTPLLARCECKVTSFSLPRSGRLQSFLCLWFPNSTAAVVSSNLFRANYLIFCFALAGHFILLQCCLANFASNLLAIMVAWTLSAFQSLIPSWR